MAKITSTVAKSDNGNVEITFSIPVSDIKAAVDAVVLKKAGEIEISGYRKGKAPASKVREKLGEDNLNQEALTAILPKALSEALVTNKVRPAIYPKFALTKKGEGAWEIKATTCEIPTFELEDYQDRVKNELKSADIWVPGKDKDEKPVEDRQKKEQKVIQTLLSLKTRDGKNVADLVPAMLVEEEVNQRLSQLVERTEKLGLSLESYLSSIHKTPAQLRQEYTQQAKSDIAFELVIQQVAEDMSIEVSNEEIDKAISTLSSDPETRKKLENPEQRQYLAATLRKRAALEKLTNL